MLIAGRERLNVVYLLGQEECPHETPVFITVPVGVP